MSRRRLFTPTTALKGAPDVPDEDFYAFMPDPQLTGAGREAILRGTPPEEAARLSRREQWTGGYTQHVYHATPYDFDDFKHQPHDIGHHVGTPSQAQSIIAHYGWAREQTPDKIVPMLPQSDKNVGRQAEPQPMIRPSIIRMKKPYRLRDMGNWNDPDKYFDQVRESPDWDKLDNNGS